MQRDEWMDVEEGHPLRAFPSASRASSAASTCPAVRWSFCFRYKELVDPQVKSAFTRAFNTATHRSGAGVYHDPGAWPPTIL